MAIGSDRNYSYQQSTWIIRSVPDAKEAAFLWPSPDDNRWRLGAKYDYLFDEKWGEVVALALPPGNYEITRFLLERGRGTFLYLRWTPRQPLAIPFRVEKGKVTYLGEMLTRSARSQPRAFELTNQVDRDMVYASRKYPALRDLPVVVTVPDTARLGIPYIVNRPIRPEDAPGIEMGPPTAPAKPPVGAADV